MKMLMKKRNAILVGMLIYNSPALSNPSLDCREDNAVVSEVTPQIALNEFQYADQSAIALSYNRSACVPWANIRWQLGIIGAKVYDDFGGGAVALTSLGASFFPLSNAPGFAVTPLVRIGAERVSNTTENTVYGAEVTFSQGLNLTIGERLDEGREISVATTRLELAFKAEYTGRKTIDLISDLRSDREQALFFSAISIDRALGDSNWRWRLGASHQTLGDTGPVTYYNSLSLSLRPVNTAHDDFSWSLELRVSNGDGEYRGIGLALTRRSTRD